MPLVSKIPAHESERGAIESAIADLLAGADEEWTIHVLPAKTAAWWLVTLERARDSYRSAFFVDPPHQTPGGIVSALKQAIADADRD